MHVEIKKIDLEKEVGRLVEIEAQIFSSADRLREEAFEGTECYWMVVDDVIAGCTSLRHNYIVSAEHGLVRCEGSIYIVSTAILPEFQGRGLGNQLKEWQVSYAKAKCFARITTTCRASNLRIIKLNEKFGFKASGIIPNCYHDPEESGTIMKLELQ